MRTRLFLPCFIGRVHVTRSGGRYWVSGRMSGIADAAARYIPFSVSLGRDERLDSNKGVDCGEKREEPRSDG